MKRFGRQLDKGAIELIEEAVHLLRRAPIAILASYYAGGLPFVLASLYFWADMSRSPFAYQHLAGGALGLAALFVWMKLCHSIFARRLRALMAGEPPPALSFRCYRRIFISQTALQSSGLFVLPFSLVLTVPFAWVYAFYQNLTALDDGEAVDLRSLMKEALLQAGLWPKQNHLLLAILSAFGLVIFLNWSILCLALPGLVKTIFGIESIFSRSVFSLLNTTFFAVMAGLTYLCVDPILKACYALRCFYGQSRRSGEDLKAELKQQSLFAAKAAAYLALVLMVLPQSSLRDRLRSWIAPSKRSCSNRNTPGACRAKNLSNPTQTRVSSDASLKDSGSGLARSGIGSLNGSESILATVQRVAPSQGRGTVGFLLSKCCCTRWWAQSSLL